MNYLVWFACPKCGHSCAVVFLVGVPFHASRCCSLCKHQFRSNGVVDIGKQGRMWMKEIRCRE